MQYRYPNLLNSCRQDQLHRTQNIFYYAQFVKCVFAAEINAEHIPPPRLYRTDYRFCEGNCPFSAPPSCAHHWVTLIYLHYDSENYADCLRMQEITLTNSYMHGQIIIMQKERNPLLMTHTKRITRRNTYMRRKDNTLEHTRRKDNTFEHTRRKDNTREHTQKGHTHEYTKWHTHTPVNNRHK